MKLDDGTGLGAGDLVMVQGVKVGKVVAISIANGSPLLELEILPGVAIGAGDTARVWRVGLMGESRIDLVPGGTGRFAKPGDTLVGLNPKPKSVNPIALLAQRFTDPLDSLAQVLRAIESDSLKLLLRLRRENDSLKRELGRRGR